MPALRLCEIGPDEYLHIECRCRRVATYRAQHAPGQLRARPSTAIADIIERLVCSSCGAREGFRVTIERERTDRSQLAGDEPPIAVIAEPQSSTNG